MVKFHQANAYAGFGMIVRVIRDSAVIDAGKQGPPAYSQQLP